MKVFVTQSCLTLCDPKDCSLPGSSAHGIFQARILEWVVISFSIFLALIIDFRSDVNIRDTILLIYDRSNI